MYAIFFDLKGPVLQIPVPKGSSVIGKFYGESVLTQLVDFYQKHRPRTSVHGIQLLHDNALAHKSATVQEYLKESRLDDLDHPPYSPDLSPCDFQLFPRLKEMLAGHRFESRCGIGSAVYQCLQHIPKENYRAAFRKWVDRCKMCVKGIFRRPWINKTLIFQAVLKRPPYSMNLKSVPCIILCEENNSCIY